MLVLALAGCGGDGGVTGDGAAATTLATDLTVSLYDGDSLVGRRTLDCSADGQTCAEVVALLPDLRADPREACTQIYGGPERYVIEGTSAGEAVSIEVTRANGCQIARFDRLQETLGSEGP
jgi:hypothetical protein